MRCIMEKKTLQIFIIITTVLIFVDPFSQQKQCSSKPMKVDIILDLSSLRNVTDMSNIRQSAIDAVALLPINSRIIVTAIERNKTRKIRTFMKTTASSKSFEQSIFTFNDYTNGRPNAKFSTVKDISEESKPWTDPKLAYIVIVIGNGGVVFDSPKRNLLKITYVIHVMDAPTTWDEMASDPDHVISPEGLTTDTVKLKALLCGDSHLSCNTDEYMRANTHFCLPCKDICKTGHDDYCKEVCKYFRPPKPTATATPPPVVVPEGDSQAPPTTGQLDPKGPMIFIVAAAFVVLTACVCWCSCSNTSRNARNLLKTAVRRVLRIPKQRQDGFAHQVTDSEGRGDTAVEETHCPDEEERTPLNEHANDPATNETQGPDEEERTPLKEHADDQATNATIVVVNEQNDIALGDGMVDLSTKPRLESELLRR